MKTHRLDMLWWAGAAGVLLCLLGVVSPPVRAQSGTELERGFIKPPGAARPWVYWF